MSSTHLPSARWVVACLVLTLTAPALPAADHFPWRRYAKQPDEWFQGAEAKRIAANVLSHQAPDGDWPKNLDTGAKPFAGDPKTLRGTFDNDATCGELRFLARMVRVRGEESYRKAFDKGLAHILKAQYPTGGWPQYYPPGKQYHRHITFNDDCMVNLMLLLRDVAGPKDFAFVSDAQRQDASKAFERGIACVLKCQIVVKGEPTAWCAQHDEKTFEPRGGRTFEPVSISGGESANVVRLLMSIEKPGPEIVKAVDAACRWYERAKVTGIRPTKRDGDLVVVPDPQAPPVWARFYEIGTNRPLFCGRDGVVKYDVAKIEAERRNGYRWYGNWGEGVLREWSVWKKKHGP